ncbi:MAG: penicillin-binding protein activator [Bdellovibrionales bacterium]|nr:penicillin-binding protein activator [Bdellovibrionales bacterium]
MKMKLALRAGLLWLALLPAATPAADDPSPEEIYLEAERAWLASNSALANKQLEKFFSLKGAQVEPKFLVKAHNLRGLIHFQAKRLPSAVKEFESAAEAGARHLEPTDGALHLARYNLMNALHKSERTAEAGRVIALVVADALDKDTRVRFFHLSGNVNGKLEDHVGAVVAFLNAAHEAGGGSASDSFIQKALNASQKIYLAQPILAVDQLEAAKTKYGWSRDAELAALLILGRGHLYVGDSEKASEYLGEVVDSTDENHMLRSQAQEILDRMEQLAEVDPSTVGILLPLSGKFARFGRQTLHATLYALGVFGAAGDGGQIRVAIRDSGDSPEAATEAFTKLIFEDKAIGVIGPLLSRQFPGVSQKAQELGAPLLSISQRKSGTQAGPFVFPLALSPAQQVEMVVDWAVNKKGYKRFAVMSPSDSFGHEYVGLFLDAMEKAGAALVGFEQYPARATDFRAEVRRLLGQDYLDGRTLEAEELRRRAEIYANSVNSKGKARERLLHAWEPKGVVDFDALFVPDDPQTVGQIVPALAVEDVMNVPLLGINTWNSPDLVQRAGRYLQNSVFVDSFLAESKNPQAVKFSQEFSLIAQTTPGALEFQAYDAARILLKALSSGNISTRSHLRDAIANLGSYKGVSGDYLFSADSGVKRSAYFLTIRGSRIIELPAQ